MVKPIIHRFTQNLTKKRKLNKNGSDRGRALRDRIVTSSSSRWPSYCVLVAAHDAMEQTSRGTHSPRALYAGKGRGKAGGI